MEPITQQSDIYEEALSQVPDSVQEFMISPGFTAIIDAASQVLQLTETQTSQLRSGAWSILMRLSTMDTLRNEWKASGWEDDLIVKALYIIDTEIITRAENIISFFTEDDSEENPPAEEVLPQAVSPLQALASVQQKLKQSSAIAPASRDYSIGRTTPETPQAFDPYREIPQGK